MSEYFITQAPSEADTPCRLAAASFWEKSVKPQIEDDKLTRQANWIAEDISVARGRSMSFSELSPTSKTTLSQVVAAELIDLTYGYVLASYDTGENRLVDPKNGATGLGVALDILEPNISTISMQRDSKLGSLEDREKQDYLSRKAKDLTGGQISLVQAVAAAGIFSLECQVSRKSDYIEIFYAAVKEANPDHGQIIADTAIVFAQNIIAKANSKGASL